MYNYTNEQIRTSRMAGISLMPRESHYVVTVPFKGRNGVTERVAYGMSIPLTKRAAGKLSRAVQSLYPTGKTRAIMVKTAAKDGLFG